MGITDSCAVLAGRRGDGRAGVGGWRSRSRRRGTETGKGVAELQDVTGLVANDVVEGLGDGFRATSGFRILEQFDGMDLPVGEVTFVPWQYGCEHVGDFHGLSASGREVLIVGVTAVEGADSGSPMFSRFIDWANVLAQLGATMAARPTLS